MIRIVIGGFGGRMGQAICKCLPDQREFELVGGLEAPGHALVGTNVAPSAPIVEKIADLPAEADCLITFSTPAATIEHLFGAVERGWNVVIGTTGLSPEQVEKVRTAAASIPIVMAPNMSIGVNLLLRLSEEAASVLGDGYDCEIVEMHHRFKVDAPSGTALGLGKAVAHGLGRNLDEVARHGREGQMGKRTKEEIGFHAVRGGDVVGEHHVIFAALGERVELVHRAHSRDTFALGALRAAEFLTGAPAALYDMRDVLGFNAS